MYALLAQFFVDGLRGGLARAHGEDDRGRAGDGVAAGVDVFKAGRAVFIDDDAAPLLRLQPGGGVADQGWRLPAKIIKICMRLC